MLYGLIITENTEFTYWDNFDYQINDSILVSNNVKKYRSSDELLKICRPVLLYIIRKESNVEIVLQARFCTYFRGKILISD